MEEKNTGKYQEADTPGKNYKPAKLRGLSRLLCRVAGSDLSILSDPRCTHEISRHERIGAIIISTAVMASVSMFFAIQTISQSPFIAFIAGIIWGFAIFILDSYIITSYKKRDRNSDEFKLILPRLILALILGCSISIPLELKFFSTEITDELVTMRVERKIENQSKANEEYNKRVNPLLDEREKLIHSNNSLKSEIGSLQNRIDSLNDKMSLERTGKGLTKQVGEGTSYNDLKDQREYAKKTILPQVMATDTPQIAINQQRVNEITSQIAAIPRPATDTIKFTGLSSQMDALKRLTSKNKYVFAAYWIFFLLILGIETAPIFVKFFTPKGSYDEILAMNEYEVFIQQQKRKSDIHELINSEIEAIRAINIKKSLAQNAINEKVMTAIADAQAAIAEKAIRLWQVQQMKKVDDNVEDFVQSKVSTNE
ncbi:MAG: DUF4407 domain-containing protein [Chitinophagaceae bacterium]